MKRIPAEQYSDEENKRVFDMDIREGDLLGLRCMIRPDEAIQLAVCVTGQTEALPPDYATGIRGRIINKKMRLQPLNFEISDGLFRTQALIRAVGDMAVEGKGYAVLITPVETGLPPAAISLLLNGAQPSS